jgi:hypothetical protein
VTVVQAAELALCSSAVVVSLVAAGFCGYLKHRLDVFEGRVRRSKLASKSRM